MTNSRTGLEKCAELFKVPAEYDVIEVSSLLERVLSLSGRFVRYRRLLLVLRALERVLGSAERGLVVDTSSNGSFSVDIAYIHYPVLLGTARSSTPHWRLYNWLAARKALRSMGKPRLALAVLRVADGLDYIGRGTVREARLKKTSEALLLVVKPLSTRYVHGLTSKIREKARLLEELVKLPLNTVVEY